MIHVRFLNNFIITVVQTSMQSDEMVVQSNQFHIQLGEIYPISQYQKDADGKLTLHFDDSTRLAGVAQRIEPEYCEIIEPKPKSTVMRITSGCGGCGKKK